MVDNQCAGSGDVRLSGWNEIGVDRRTIHMAVGGNLLSASSLEAAIKVAETREVVRANARGCLVFIERFMEKIVAKELLLT